MWTQLTSMRTALLLLILREGLVLSAFGILAGVGMAWAASGALASLLYEVSATDPITFVLQSHRRATRVTDVMPQRELMRTEFFTDFLSRDGLHWGMNLHAFEGSRALGDLRIWRRKGRGDFGDHEKALLDLQAPVVRVTGYDVPYPYWQIEDAYMPSVARVVDASRRLLEF